jgi:hypothetical protein
LPGFPRRGARLRAGRRIAHGCARLLACCCSRPGCLAEQRKKGRARRVQLARLRPTAAQAGRVVAFALCTAGSLSPIPRPWPASSASSATRRRRNRGRGPRSCTRACRSSPLLRLHADGRTRATFSFDARRRMPLYGHTHYVAAEVHCVASPRQSFVRPGRHTWTRHGGRCAGRHTLGHRARRRSSGRTRHRGGCAVSRHTLSPSCGRQAVAAGHTTAVVVLVG